MTNLLNNLEHLKLDKMRSMLPEYLEKVKKSYTLCSYKTVMVNRNLTKTNYFFFIYGFAIKTKIA